MNNSNNPVAEATQELNNVVIETTSVELSQNDMTDEKKVVAHTTRIANINGEEVSIIIAHTKYGMELPKDKQNLIGSLDRSKMLDCIFHLAKPEIFWAVDMPLVGENNESIEKDTANVYVLCPTADSYWRVAVDEKLQNVEIHDFANVQEYAQAVGCTNLYSRGLSNTEKVGVAALATGDEATKAVFEFAKKYAMPNTTARLYLDYKVTPLVILSMTMGELPKDAITLGRTVAEAEELFKQTQLTFEKNALKRYAIRSINSLLHKGDYSFEDMVVVLKAIPANEIASVEAARCEDRQDCITSVLTKWLEVIKSESAKVKEAA